MTNVHFCEQDGLRKSLPIHAQTAGLEQQGSEGAGPSPVGLSLIQLGVGDKALGPRGATASASASSLSLDLDPHLEYSQ